MLASAVRLPRGVQFLAMRKLVLALGISIDGYIARPDGAVDFLFMPKDYAAGHAEFMARIDTAILGRKTWDVAMAMGGSFGAIVPYVLSRSLPPGQRGGVTFTSRTPGALVRDLRRRP